MKDSTPNYILKIAKKRFHKEGEKWFVFYTSGYGGNAFFIPKSQIIFKDFDDPEWIRLKIKGFIFKKIKFDLEAMRQSEVKITEAGI